MVQRLQPAGTLPTEESPLLNETGRQNVGLLTPSETDLNGNGKNITNVAIKRVDESDEESVASGEVETQIGRGQVVRIISVLLIGNGYPSPLFAIRMLIQLYRHFRGTHRRFHPAGNPLQYCLRV